MFADHLERFAERTAVITKDGRTLTYAQLCIEVERFCAQLGTSRQLIFLQACNDLEPLIAYLAALRGRHPVILSPEAPLESFADVMAEYRPDVVFHRQDGQWLLHRPSDRPGSGEYHEQLALLLSTSGTTGSGKMVRLSSANLEANAQSIAEYLAIDEAQRAITSR